MRKSLGSAQLRRAAARRRPRVLPTTLFLAWLSGLFSLATAASQTPITALTKEDLRRADDARQRALETTLSQAPTFWTNEASGNAGVVTPIRTYRTSTGYYCRVYRERLFRHLGGETTKMATACRDDQGVWRPVSED